jgi:hypothetical protein
LIDLAGREPGNPSRTGGKMSKVEITRWDGRKFELEFMQSRFGRTQEVCEVYKGGRRRYIMSEDYRTVSPLIFIAQKKEEGDLNWVASLRQNKWHACKNGSLALCEFDSEAEAREWMED